MKNNSGRINKIFKILPRVKAKLKNIYGLYLIAKSRRRNKHVIKKLKGKTKVKVVFLAIHSSTWKYDQLVRLFEQDGRFEITIVVCPLVYFNNEDMLKEMETTYKFYIGKKLNVIKAYTPESKTWLDIKRTIKPDILFFTNPWDISKPQYLIKSYLGYLTCFSPYGFYLSELTRKSYRYFFHSVLWRNFLETEVHRVMYERTTGHTGNAIVTGYPGTDELIDPAYKPKNVWKNSEMKRKKIIWAPHHTINDAGGELDFSSFLIYYDFMINLAEKHKDKIQIAFKPHPLLKNKLSLDENWGKEKTELYYRQWDQMENGQLCEQDYIDLFLTSDAMIFDSISFIAEYLYVNKPSLFLMKDLKIEEHLNEFGKLAIKQHYYGFTEEQITLFVENVVMQDIELKKNTRRDFFEQYLRPQNSKTASENIFNEIVKYL